MSGVLGGLLIVLLACVLVPVTVLLTQVVCAVMPRRPDPLPESRRPRLAVLIPAHNESVGILTTLNSVAPQLLAHDRLVVVADNCTDDTARVAAEAGADVVERHDTTLRGKGYALAFGTEYLGQDPPELVVIVDADCEVTAGAIDRIARVSAATGRPVQSMYLLKAPPSADVMASIAEFAMVVKDLVRPLGYHRLGLPCQLVGSGMAIPWTALRSTQLAGGHIVEDMKMGIDFARAGIPPLFCPEALVLSYFPANAEGTASQRTRWEHGHLAMIISDAPSLFLDALKGKGSGILPLALDLCVPPVALLTMVIVALVALSAVYAMVSGSVVPLAMAGVILLMFATAIGISWLRFGSDVVPFGALLLAFSYVFRKIPLYLKFLVRRQVEWVRSKRDDH